MDYGLVAAFAVAGLFSLAVTIAGVAFVRVKYRVDLNYLGYGAIVFFLSQVITRIPVVIVLQMLLQDTVRSSPTILYIWIVGLAFTAGLFEEVGRYLGYRYLFRNGKTWHNALMYGLGHGGLEAILLGAGGMLLSLINYVVISNAGLIPGGLPGAQPEQIAQAKAAFAAIQWWMPLLGGFERLGALIIQVSLSVVVLQAFLRQTKLWLYAAIAYHTIVNFVAVIVMMQLGPVMAEAAVAFFTLISLCTIWAFQPRGSVRIEPAP